MLSKEQNNIYSAKCVIPQTVTNQFVLRCVLSFPQEHFLVIGLEAFGGR